MNAEQMKQQYLNFINLHGIAPEEFVIVAGGSMLLRGHRESSEDIDVSVGKAVFYGLVNRVVNGQLNDAKLLLGDAPYVFAGRTSTEPTGHHLSGKPVIAVGEFEIHYDPEFMEKLEFDVIDGVGLQTLKSIYELKKKWNRPKDQNDLVLLNYLVNYSTWAVPRVSAAIEVLKRQLGDDWSKEQPRSIGFEVAKWGWVTTVDLSTLREFGSVHWSEINHIKKLLVGNKLDGEEDQTGMILEVIKEFVKGAKCALKTIHY